MNPELKVPRLQARIELLEDVVGAMYQFAGEVGAPVRMLDALWAAAQGGAVNLSNLTAVYTNDCEEESQPCAGSSKRSAGSSPSGRPRRLGRVDPEVSRNRSTRISIG